MTLKKSWVIPSEFQECQAFYEWSKLNHVLRDYLIHHPNEGKRTVITGRRLNLIGLRKGLPDYQLPIPNKKWNGFWLEMKKRDAKNKKKSENQVDWLKKLSEKGHFVCFAYGWEDAAKKITDYLNNVL